MNSKILCIVEQRFLDKIELKESGLITDCWKWLGAKTKDGYGRLIYNKKLIRVHRLSFELFKGKIIEGLQIDHLCRNRDCVNPDHLEAVTQIENIKRGEAGKHNSVKTHCPKGHPYSGDNLYVHPTGKRICLICNAKRMIDYRLRRKS